MNTIPDILTSLSGKKITTQEMWENFRCDEIMNLFCEYVYGVRDIEKTENLNFTIKEENIEYGMRVKFIEAGFNDFSFPFRLYLPEK